MKRFAACSIVLLFALCAGRAGAAGFQVLGAPGTLWSSEASRWVAQGDMVGLGHPPDSTPLATAGPIRKAIAEDCTWDNDAGDNDGNNPDNWSLNHVPGNDEVARFDDTSPDESCTFSGNLSCEGMAATADYGNDINLGANDIALGSMGLVLDHTGGFDCGLGDNSITDGPFDNKDVGGLWTVGTARWTFHGSGDITGHHLRAVDKVTFVAGSHYRIHEDTDSRFSVNTECQVLGDLTLDGCLAFFGDCDATVADGATFDGDSTLCLYDSRASHGLVSMGTMSLSRETPMCKSTRA